VFHKRHFGLTSKFFNTLKAEVQKSPNDCPLIILGNFNIDILDDINHKNNKQKLIEFMNCKSKSQFKNNTTNLETKLEIFVSSVDLIIFSKFWKFFIKF